jgi:hypothetical protein
MPSQSKNSLPFVAVLVLSLILSVRAGTAADQTLSPPPGGEFGSAVDIEGNIAVIGNPHIRGSGRQIQGVAYIFERGPAGWQLVKTLLPPATGDRFTRFGAQVTLAGNRLAIGDVHFSEDDLDAGHTGRVYVYEKHGATWPDVPAHVIEPSQPNVFSFGQAHAFSGEYLAVTEFVSFQSAQSIVRVRTFWLQNGLAIPLGQVERAGGDYFGFVMSMSGSELAILNIRKGMVLAPTKGSVYLYDLSGGKMQQTADVSVPMEVGDYFSSPKMKFEGDRLVVTKSTSIGGGVVLFKRTVAGWHETSEVRPPMVDGLLDYLTDAAGNALLTFNASGTDLYTMSEPPRFVRRLDAESLDGLAASPDTAMIVRRNEVLFTSMRSLVASDSVVVDPSEAIAPGGSIDLGELVAGKECKVEVELLNASTEPMQLTGVQITPVIGANSLTGHSFTPVTLPPLGKTRVKLTLNPPSAGTYRMSLEVLHPGAAQAPYAYRLDFEARAGDFAPFVSETAASVLIAKGEPVKLRADATGPRGRFSCQWYKDGRALTRSTQPFLYIPSAQPAHAGRYRLDVWAAGSPRMSCALALGVFERQASSVIAKPSEFISLTARFWGPGIQVRWNGYSDFRPLPETWAIQGTQTATLSIPSPMALAGYEPMRISAELVMEETVTVISNNHVVELLRAPVIAVTGNRYGRLGEPLSTLNLSDLSGQSGGAFFSAEGLPPGVQFISNGYQIEGIPTQAGDYAVKIMAENLYGSAVPFKLNLKIYAAGEEPNLKPYFGAPHQTAGIFMIPEPNIEAPPWPGLVRVQPTAGTGFSGSLAFGPVRRPFSGQWTVKAEDGARSATVRLAPFLGYRSVVLELAQNTVEESYPANGIEAALSLDHASTDVSSVQINARLEPLIPMNKEWRNALAGRYSFLMGSQAGQGFGSFTVGSDFQATGVGTLSDGTGFTFSMPVVRGRNGPSDIVVMLVGLGSSPTRLWGRINTMDSGIDEAGMVTGILTMARPAKSGARLLPEGYNTEVPVRGGRYFVPKGMPLGTKPGATAEEAGRASITLAANGLPESIQTGLTFTKTGKVIVDQPNTSDLKLQLFAQIGLFIGSFKVNEPVPGTENQFARRTVFFGGMVIPQRRIGGGFFHFSPLPNRFAEPPTTSATTPIYVGGVTLE